MIQKHKNRGTGLNLSNLVYGFKDIIWPNLNDKDQKKYLEELGFKNCIFSQIICEESKESEYQLKIKGDDATFSIVSYNIEFGKNIKDIIDFLNREELTNSDAIILTEVDRYNERTRLENLPNIIKTKTGLGYIYGVEFLELDKKEGYIGKTGNILLSRHEIKNPYIIRLHSGKDWLQDRCEPRMGGRMAVKGEITKNGKSIIIYGTHLEVRTNPLHRSIQMEEILKDAEQYQNTPIIIGGDFNFTGRERVLHHLKEYQDPFGSARASTLNNMLGKVLNLKPDRIFSKGLRLLKARIYQEFEGSDHYPILAEYKID